jgi:hypothetical protein
MDVDDPIAEVLVEIVGPVARTLAVRSAREADLGQGIGILFAFRDVDRRGERGGEQLG